mmetsp:Transcript_39993/g.95727  ORF Transcript_39993/g.95727 Transcript_39993/m.95727 type:complete len:134 (+) Transcript_39993:548-949(+)
MRSNALGSACRLPPSKARVRAERVRKRPRSSCTSRPGGCIQSIPIPPPPEADGGASADGGGGGSVAVVANATDRRPSGSIGGSGGVGAGASKGLTLRQEAIADGGAGAAVGRFGDAATAATAAMDSVMQWSVM